LHRNVTYCTVPAYLVWDVLVFVQEHVQLADADAQVAVCELVGDIEAQGAKLPALDGVAVEQTQREEQRLELLSLERER
jgi:hypothetical protein